MELTSEKIKVGLCWPCFPASPTSLYKAQMHHSKRKQRGLIITSLSALTLRQQTFLSPCCAMSDVSSPWNKPDRHLKPAFAIFWNHFLLFPTKHIPGKGDHLECYFLARQILRQGVLLLQPVVGLSPGDLETRITFPLLLGASAAINSTNQIPNFAHVLDFIHFPS